MHNFATKHRDERPAPAADPQPFQGLRRIGPIPRKTPVSEYVRFPTSPCAGRPH